MVLLVHAPVPWVVQNSKLGPSLLKGLSSGSYGVDLFFCLSGFLISGLLFDEFKRSGHIDLIRFWIRRGFKIWPSYYVAYGMAIAVAMASRSTGVGDLAAQWPNFVFLQNYLNPACRWFASWSLAVEEHFYAICPILILAALCFRRYGRRLMVMLCLSIVICVVCLRAIAIHDHVSPSLLWIQTHYRADGLAAGVLLGYVVTFCEVNIRTRVPMIALLLTLVGAFSLPLILPATIFAILGHTMMSMLFVMCIWIAARYPDVGQNGFAAPLVRILSIVGVYSYTIYLSQACVVAFIDSRPHASWGGAKGVVFVFGSVLIGVALSHLVERPFLGMREKWFPRRKVLQHGKC